MHLLTGESCIIIEADYIQIWHQHVQTRHQHVQTSIGYTIFHFYLNFDNCFNVSNVRVKRKSCRFVHIHSYKIEHAS